MRKLLVIATAFSLILPGVSSAQTSPPAGAFDSSNTIPEVVVTARKIVERLQDVPIAVTSISGNDLKDRSVKTVSDLEALVPGMVIQQGPDDSQTLLFLLRGREQNDVALPIDPSVGLYVDGHYIPRTLGMQGSLLDINRVEVLRGPQGTLYGKNSTGGTVSIFTNDPTNRPFASIDLTAGNYGARDVVGIANVPINDNFSTRFVVQRGVTNGYGHDAVGDRLLSEDSQSYRAKVLAKLSDRWSTLVSADYQTYQSGGYILKLVGLVPAGGGSPQGGLLTQETELERNQNEAQAIGYLNSLIAAGHQNFYDSFGSGPGTTTSARTDVGVTIRGDLGNNINFVSISGFQYIDRKLFFPSPLPIQAVYGLGGITVTDSYYSQEFQLLGQTGPFKWVAGIYDDYESGHDFTSIVVFPALTSLIGIPSLSISRNELINRTIAPFGQAVWEFIPAWRLTSGVRYSSDTREMHASDVTIDQLGRAACVVPAPGYESTALPGSKSLCPRKFKNSFGQPSWLASIDHSLTSDVLAYVKIASGYRSGGENEGGAVEIESFAPFKQETNIEYEAGVKSEFLNHDLRLNLAAYRDEYSNLQVTTGILAADGSFVTVVSNAANAIIRGIEAEADVVVGHGLKFHGSTAYTDPQYGRFIDRQLGDRSHEKFTVPRWTATVSAEWEQPVSFGRIRSGLEYDYRSSINLNPTSASPSLVTQKAVALLNARLNCHVDAWRMDVALFGKNITQQKYYATGGTLEGIGAEFLYAGAPGTYGIEIIKTFGE